MKECTKCLQIKGLSEFHKRHDSKDGLAYICKLCRSVHSSLEELYKLCHYTNLQPLWAEDNIRKGDSIGA